MATVTFTKDDFKGYHKGDKRHCFYEEACKKADEIAIHADGLFPVKLLRERRPNEPLEVFIYREIIFVAKTKSAFTKVFSSLQKIRRSNDWNIDYGNKEDSFSAIAEGEKLSDYCEKKFPYFTSVTNWVFNLVLRKYMIDPNAVVVVMPIDMTAPLMETERYKPYPFIYDSKYVLDYVEEDYAVIENPAGAPYTDSKGNYIIGKSYLYITTLSIVQFDQINSRNEFGIVSQINHGLPFLPVKKLGGVLVNQVEGQFFYESRIGGMIPELNEAIREYSDLQAAKVLHIYPERWQWNNIECPTCKGNCEIINPLWNSGRTDGTPSKIECPRCHGTGHAVNEGPYSKLLIGPTNGAVGEQGNVPIPPAGFIEKDVEIIKIQDEGVDKHIYNAYSSINFEFLAETPLNQSGTAKEVDKDELNNTVNSFAEDLVAIMDFVYKAIAYYRYSFTYPNGQVEEMLPNIAVPVNYDLLGSSNIQLALTAAKNSGANPVIINALEIDYAGKVFYSDPEVKDMLLLELELDPLPNIDQSDKVVMLSNKGITQLTYVVSSNIHAFVQRAIEENKNFAQLKTSDQKAKIESYAQKMIDDNAAKTKIAKAIFDPNQSGLNDANGNPILNDANGNPILNDANGNPINTQTQVAA